MIHAISSLIIAIMISLLVNFIFAEKLSKSKEPEDSELLTSIKMDFDMTRMVNEKRDSFIDKGSDFINKLF